MAYNPLSDPQSSYNNPKKGPRSSGAPGGGIPLRGPLSPEQDEFMKKDRKGSTTGRKPCSVCNKRPPDMVKHFGENADTHGPVASSNPHAMKNVPGLRNISENVLGGLMGGGFNFNDRRKK